MSKSLDEFKAEARKIYDDARDQGRMMAELTIAQALIQTYYRGAEEVLAEQKRKLEAQASAFPQSALEDGVFDA